MKRERIFEVHLIFDLDQFDEKKLTEEYVKKKLDSLLKASGVDIDVIGFVDVNKNKDDLFEDVEPWPR